ncbi:PAS domain-containing protein (plasmid) [Aliirhizobium terrae]|uniref:PAS domain-containing protein n=1 Tax=Terrirhizobium terrae TaxID=2926709 RepID=UPI002578A1E8|nr:PAS domain-containing protein [Rhizobium sp. CC-CFT758]WJH37965.1 PAS domain-containing protein [Rhizobium sp. CC-CFT758]
MIASTISIEEIKALVDALPGLGWAAWPNGEFICQSVSMEAYTGFPSSKFVERDALSGEFAWSELLHVNDYSRLEQAWLAAVQSVGTFDVAHRVRTANGSFRWLRTTARAQTDATGKIVFWLGTCVDIHEAISEVEASRERERVLQNFIDAVPVPIWSADCSGNPTYFNQALKAQVGISDTNTIQKFTLDEVLSRVIHPDDLSRVSSALKATFAGGERFKQKYRQVRADGGFRWTNGEVNALRDDKGVVMRWLGVAQDIDDEVSAQAAISEREARLALIIETMPGLLWVSSPDGQPTYFSRQLEQWSGLTVDKITHSEVDVLKGIIEATIHPDHQEEVETTIRKSFKSGEPWFRRFRQRRFDGTWRWLEARMEPLRDENGKIVQWYGLQVDIENEFLAQESLRISQDKLARASRFAGMAELSASIAHELSQPLAAVIMSADACKRWLDMSPPNTDRAAHSADSVVRDANIASEVVKRIRALFQHKSEGRENVDINLLILSVKKLLSEELISHGIRLDLKLAKSLEMVSVDSIQIQQVLVNLVHNGVEAMVGTPGRERLITVKTFPSELGPVVEITDAGNGFQDVDRAFMPFFTTRESGMGMGLSICESIITSHGGKIWAENVDQGARVSFTVRGSFGEPINTAERAR